MLRGGSWNNNAENCRVANRNNNNPNNANNNYGFRLANTASVREGYFLRNVAQRRCCPALDPASPPRGCDRIKPGSGPFGSLKRRTGRTISLRRASGRIGLNEKFDGANLHSSNPECIGKYCKATRSNIFQYKGHKVRSCHTFVSSGAPRGVR